MTEAGRLLVVLDPGALTTVQDLGRPGHAHLGVPRSGALDEPALRLANRLVGNPEDAAGLETTLTGARLRVTRPTTFAVTGAACEVVVGGRAEVFGGAVTAPAGAEIRVGPATRGVRSYVAVAGGVDVAPVLGSRSTDQLSGLGPAPLAAGDELPVGAPTGEPDGSWSVPSGAPTVLHVRPGPRADWFAADSLAALDGAIYTVAPDSNRIGLRLQGAALRRVREDELASEGMVLGAVQVPPSGQPVVFLNDHPTTGGYPVVGVVRRADLPVAAQARPGDTLELRLLR
jgi:biotin-dependent carboxylase-like uncharacterized protein